MTEIARKTILVDGLATGYLEAGQGDPVVLLHGGEFGAGAELGWENNIAALAAHYRVLALDMLGFGDSAKVIDFNDGRGMRIRHIARFCDAVGVESAHFVGNSMGAVNMFVDATSESPVLPARSMVTICGGGEIQRNEHSAALYDYDATLSGMRRIVEALFCDPSYPADDAYVQRRYESSIAPGAWEALAAARFRRPGSGAAVATVERSALRAHRRSDAGGGGGVRQTPATGVGGGDRGSDRRRSFVCGRQRPVTARRSSNHRLSTTCWWTS